MSWSKTTAFYVALPPCLLALAIPLACSTSGDEPAPSDNPDVQEEDEDEDKNDPAATGGAAATGGVGGVNEPDPAPPTHTRGGTAGAGGGESSDDDPCEGESCVIDCDDHDDATTDWHDEGLGCAHRKVDWSVFDSGLQFDHSTNLGWWMLEFPTYYPEVEATCAELEEAGRTDWMLPTIDQTRTWAAGCANTLPGSSCALSDPACLDSTCGLGAECSSCRGNDGPNDEGQYCRPEIPQCFNLWTSSECTSGCNEGTIWVYGFTNGNFHPLNPIGGRHGACVATFDSL